MVIYVVIMSKYQTLELGIRAGPLKVVFLFPLGRPLSHCVHFAEDNKLCLTGSLLCIIFGRPALCDQSAE